MTRTTLNGYFECGSLSWSKRHFNYVTMNQVVLLGGRITEDFHPVTQALHDFCANATLRTVEKHIGHFRFKA